MLDVVQLLIQRCVLVGRDLRLRRWVEGRLLRAARRAAHRAEWKWHRHADGEQNVVVGRHRPARPGDGPVPHVVLRDTAAILASTFYFVFQHSPSQLLHIADACYDLSWACNTALTH